MAVPVRVTGAWTQLLSDWLDVHQLAAPDLRLRLDSRRPDEPVPMLLWQHRASGRRCLDIQTGMLSTVLFFIQILEL